MEWITTLLAGLALAVLLAPVFTLFATIFVLVPLAHLVPRAPMINRVSLDCPFSKSRVAVEFLNAPGAEQPSDVLGCSFFSDGREVRCEKGCLALARTGWGPSPMVPRYSLVAGSVALR